MTTEKAYQRKLLAALTRPGAVPDAEGRPVTVTGLRATRQGREEQLLIEYSLPDTPPGICQQPNDDNARRRFRPDDPAAYAAELGPEIQMWAVEHVRRFHPPEPIDRDLVRRELTPIDELWKALTDRFADVTPVPGGFRGTAYHATVTVVLTPEQWQERVISCEIGCRMDHGIDANGEGDGLLVAWEAMDETLATMDPDETFLVLDPRRGFRGSTRAELPAVPGTADEREHGELMRRLEVAKAENPGVEYSWFAYRPDGTQSRLADD